MTRLDIALLIKLSASNPCRRNFESELTGEKRPGDTTNREDHTDHSSNDTTFLRWDGVKGNDHGRRVEAATSNTLESSEDDSTGKSVLSFHGRVRSTHRESMLGAKPHARENDRKMTKEPISMAWRPKMSLSREMIIAKAGLQSVEVLHARPGPELTHICQKV